MPYAELFEVPTSNDTLHVYYHHVCQRFTKILLLKLTVLLTESVSSADLLSDLEKASEAMLLWWLPSGGSPGQSFAFRRQGVTYRKSM